MKPLKIFLMPPNNWGVLPWGGTSEYVVSIINDVWAKRGNNPIEFIEKLPKRKKNEKRKKAKKS